MGDLTYTNSMMNEIRELLLNERQHVAVQVNTELLSTYWNVGRIIVEHEQENKERADYGKQTLKQLSKGFNKGVWERILCFQSPIYATVLSKLSNSTDGVC